MDDDTQRTGLEEIIVITSHLGGEDRIEREQNLGLSLQPPQI